MTNPYTSCGFPREPRELEIDQKKKKNQKNHTLPCFGKHDIACIFLFK